MRRASDSARKEGDPFFHPASILNKLNALPLVSSDDIARRRLQWASIDNFAQYLTRANIPCVTNTDISTSEGIHWITLVRVSKTVCIIDPLGPDNERPYDDMMFGAIRDLNCDAHIFPHKFQLASSSSCGYFAMYVAELIKSLAKPTPQSIDNAVERAFGDSADTGDLQRIAAYFHL